MTEIINGGFGRPSALKLEVAIAMTPIKPMPIGKIDKCAVAATTTSGSSLIKVNTTGPAVNKTINESKPQPSANQ